MGVSSRANVLCCLTCYPRALLRCFSDPTYRLIRQISSGGTLTNVQTSFSFSTSPLGLASDGAVCALSACRPLVIRSRDAFPLPAGWVSHQRCRILQCKRCKSFPCPQARLCFFDDTLGLLQYLRNVTAILVAGSASNICGYSGVYCESLCRKCAF